MKMSRFSGFSRAVILLSMAVLAIFGYQKLEISKAKETKMLEAESQSKARMFEAESQSKARRVVEKFCSAEADADEFERREEIIHITSDDSERWFNEVPDYPSYMFNFLDHSFDIIDSYEIFDVHISKDSGVAKVKYKVIGHSIGVVDGGLKVSRTLPSSEIINLDLIRISGQWKILDPPKPKVMIPQLIKAYEDLLCCSYIEKTSPQEYVDMVRKNLRVLQE